MLVVGLMNLVWMAAIFSLFLIEKSWKHGLVAAKIAGALLIALGAAVVVWPARAAAHFTARLSPCLRARYACYRCTPWRRHLRDETWNGEHS